MEKELYFVAVKLFLRDGTKLLITHDIYGEWDLPGGRLLKTELNTPLGDVMERKVREELGDRLKYELGGVKVFFRVERLEQNLTGDKAHIFGIGYEAKYLGGELGLGDHHDKMEWVDVNTFKPEDYFTTGWLEGVQEYLKRSREAGHD